MIWVGKNLAEQGVLSCVYDARDVGLFVFRLCYISYRLCPDSINLRQGV